MKRTVVPILTVIGLTAIMAIPTYARDYRCKDVSGCIAQIPENGQLKTVLFRKGDIISTEEGWIVNPTNGWAKVKSSSTET